MTNKTDLNRELAEAMGWKFGNQEIGKTGLWLPPKGIFLTQTRFDPLHDDAQCMGLMDIPLERGYRVQFEKIGNRFYCDFVFDKNSIECLGKDKREAFCKALLKLLESEDD